MEGQNYPSMGRKEEVEMATIPACPRCSNTDTQLIADSPIAGAWQVYGCNHCTYLWRNTETLDGIRTISEEELQAAVLDFPPPATSTQF